MERQELYEMAIARNLADRQSGVPTKARASMLNRWLRDLIEWNIVPSEVVEQVIDRLIFEGVIVDEHLFNHPLWAGDHLSEINPLDHGWHPILDGSVLARIS